MSQTRADFYLLNDENVDKSLHFACRLLEKAYLSGHRIFVRCQDEEQATLLDDRLWTFSATSFIPHHRVITKELNPMDSPIEISTAEPPKTSADILFNLSPLVPHNPLQFKRILELVLPHEEAKIISRAHYKAYKAQGVQIETHSRC